VGLRDGRREGMSSDVPHSCFGFVIPSGFSHEESAFSCEDHAR